MWSIGAATTTSAGSMRRLPNEAAGQNGDFSFVVTVMARSAHILPKETLTQTASGDERLGLPTRFIKGVWMAFERAPCLHPRSGETAAGRFDVGFSGRGDVSFHMLGAGLRPA